MLEIIYPHYISKKHINDTIMKLSSAELIEFEFR